MDTNHTPDDWPDDNIINLKRINIQACCGSAGVQNYEDDAFVEQIQVSRPWFQENISKIREQGYELITASGDSMEPTFRNGDLIVVDRQDRDLKRDGVFCVLVDGDLYVKRVQRIPGAILFISDNSLYRPFEIPLKEVEFRLQVLGRVVNSMNLKDTISWLFVFLVFFFKGDGMGLFNLLKSFYPQTMSILPRATNRKS